MYRNNLQCLVCCIAVLAVADRSLACRYNVRDIAFVDLSQPRFALELSGPAPQVEALAAEIRTQLADDTIAMAHPTKGDDLPLTVTLVAPDGRRRAIPFDPADVVASVKAALLPTDRRLLGPDDLLKSHSIVVYLPGSSDSETAVEQTITDAIGEIEAGRALWPKAIRGKIQLIKVTAEQRKSHELLLWCLGLDTDDDSAQVAVAFGRMRRLGEILLADDLGAGMLPKLLRVLSMDCECEYDIAPLIGAMLPHRWDDTLAAEAVECLGFDPGHPLVLIEVQQILARRETLGAAVQSPLDAALGYQEIALPMLSPSSDKEASEPQVDEAVDDNVAASPLTKATRESAGGGSTLGDSNLYERSEEPLVIPVATVIWIVAAMSAGGCLFLWWNRR